MMLHQNTIALWMSLEGQGLKEGYGTEGKGSFPPKWPRLWIFNIDYRGFKSMHALNVD